jgi:hypothetical protein
MAYFFIYKPLLKMMSKNILIQQQRLRQIESTNYFSEYCSGLDLIMARFQMRARSAELQGG